MLQILTAISQHFGLWKTMLTCFKANTRAIQFYRRLGFDVDANRYVYFIFLLYICISTVIYAIFSWLFAALRNVVTMMKLMKYSPINQLYNKIYFCREKVRGIKQHWFFKKKMRAKLGYPRLFCY